MNPFFNPQQGLPGPFQNMAALVQAFNQFKSSFSGNPQQQVEDLMRSGRMSQEQFQQFSQMAQNLRNFLH